MFSNVIDMLNNQINKLELKLKDIETISPVAEKVAEDIKSILVLIEPYPEEKALFIESILQVVNYRVGDVTEAITPPNNNVEGLQSTIPELNQITEHLHEFGGKHYIYFDNLKSRNGSNSLKSWQRELSGMSSALSITDIKVDGRYLMIIDNADISIVEYMKSIDFTLTPEANTKLLIESVSEVIPNETNTDTILPEVNQDNTPLDMGDDDEFEVANNIDNESGDNGNDSSKSVIEVVENIEIESNPILQRLTNNQYVGKEFVGGNTILYIGFELASGFGHISNADLWSSFIIREYPGTITDTIENWESSSIEGKYLLRVETNTINDVLELTKYDFLQTPIRANMMLNGNGISNNKTEETIETAITPEVIESGENKVELVEFDPDDEFEVL
jgi:hypothetical protein